MLVFPRGQHDGHHREGGSGEEAGAGAGQGRLARGVPPDAGPDEEVLGPGPQAEAKLCRWDWAVD